MAPSSGKAAAPVRSPVLNRRLILLGVVFLGGLARPGKRVRAAEPGEAALSEAIRFLAHEKSAAEQYAVILATVGKTDTAQYVRGIELYADAKAEFDGLIAELKFDLTTGQDPARSAKFTEALQGAAAKRVAFTSFVSHEVVDKFEGARPGLPDVLNVVPELVKAITDAGLSIWKAYRDNGKERRDAILNELGRLQWRSFSDLVKARAQITGGCDGAPDKTNGLRQGLGCAFAAGARSSRGGPVPDRNCACAVWLFWCSPSKPGA
ncbi:MAG: hypothetical protein WBW81_12825 [Methylocella sp.]